MNEKVNGPMLTLSDLYNDDVVYTSRPSYISNPWLKPDEHQSNFLTGRELLIGNRFPVIVHEASVTEKLAYLFDLVGKQIPTHIYKFNNKETYEELLQTLAHKDGKKIYFQYIHDEDILEKEYYALNKDTFVALNNKSRIPEWTNNKYLPDREIVPIEEFETRIQSWAYPFVIKPGDDLPTAGGYGVMICYNNKDLEQAKQRIKEATEATDYLIIEQKIEAVSNYCVQYAYAPDLGIKYLGTAQQLTNEYGFYNGNENVNDVPQHVIDAGKEIMEIGVSKGFFGVAGFDLLVDKNNDVFAIDLKVKHIYKDSEPPISGDLTAANFGNVLHHLDNNFSPADKLSSVIGVVGEVITTMAITLAREYQTENVVYIGSSFNNNHLLREVIEDYTVLRGFRPYYIENGAFSGALGALYL